jgi:hypothetical protein
MRSSVNVDIRYTSEKFRQDSQRPGQIASGKTVAVGKEAAIRIEKGLRRDLQPS